MAIIAEELGNGEGGFDAETKEADDRYVGRGVAYEELEDR